VKIICRLEEFSGACSGEMLTLQDNSMNTHYCERHARMVTAWIQSPHEAGPIWLFTEKLSTDGWKDFEVKMASVELDTFAPYVPRPTKRALDAANAARQQALFPAKTLRPAKLRGIPSPRK